MLNLMKQFVISQAINARLKFDLDTKSNINIFGILKEKQNFTIVFMPFDDTIDGFSHKKNDHYIIVINSNNNNNRNNFTCAHELYHLLFEYKNGKYIKDPKSEEKANIFASYFLIPEDALYIYLQNNNLLKNKLDLKDIVKIEDYFQVSRIALLIRLKDMALITQQEFEQYNRDIIRSVKKFGGNINNHTDHKSPEKYTIGEYTVMAEKLLNRNKISNGKYEEYMLDAFNYKQIYGDVEDI